MSQPSDPRQQPSDKSNRFQRFLRNWVFGIPKDLQNRRIESVVEELNNSDELKQIIGNFKDSNIENAKIQIEKAKEEFID